MTDSEQERTKLYTADDWNRRLLEPESDMRSVNHGYHTALNEIATLSARLELAEKVVDYLRDDPGKSDYARGLIAVYDEARRTHD